MITSGDAARIKIWSGNIPSNNSTSSGGGSGYVRNVTYNGIHDVSTDCECFLRCGAFEMLMDE